VLAGRVRISRVTRRARGPRRRPPGRRQRRDVHFAL